MSQTEAPTLGVVDIDNALKIIDYACEQGAFKGWNTIEQVQNCRNKLAAFVAFTQQAQAQAEAEQASEQAATEAAEQPAA